MVGTGVSADQCCLILRVCKDSQKGIGKRKVRGCSSDGRAPALQAGGRQFESVHLHQMGL